MAKKIQIKIVEQGLDPTEYSSGATILGKNLI